MIYYVITSLLIFPGIIYLLLYLKNRRLKSSDATQTHHPSIASLLQKMVEPVVSSSWFPRIVSIVLGGTVFFFLFRIIYPNAERSFQTVIQAGVFIVMSILIFLSALNFFVPMDVRARLSFYAITVFVFFALLLLWKLYSGYLHSGVSTCDSWSLLLSPHSHAPDWFTYTNTGKVEISRVASINYRHCIRHHRVVCLCIHCPAILYRIL